MELTCDEVRGNASSKGGNEMNVEGKKEKKLVRID